MWKMLIEWRRVAGHTKWLNKLRTSHVINFSEKQKKNSKFTRNFCFLMFNVLLSIQRMHECALYAVGKMNDDEKKIYDENKTS